MLPRRWDWRTRTQSYNQYRLAEVKASPASSSPSSPLLCQLLWGGPEGMLMACCPHTPWHTCPWQECGSIPLKPPGIWHLQCCGFFFFFFQRPRLKDISFFLVSFFSISLSLCCLKKIMSIGFLFHAVRVSELAWGHERNYVAWLASSVNEALLIQCSPFSILCYCLLVQQTTHTEVLTPHPSTPTPSAHVLSAWWGTNSDRPQI